MTLTKKRFVVAAHLVLLVLITWQGVAFATPGIECEDYADDCSFAYPIKEIEAETFACCKTETGGCCQYSCSVINCKNENDVYDPSGTRRIERSGGTFAFRKSCNANGFCL